MRRFKPDRTQSCVASARSSPRADAALRIAAPLRRENGCSRQGGVAVDSRLLAAIWSAIGGRESAGCDGAEARSCVADDGAGRRDKHYGVVSGPHRVDVDCFLGSAVCSSSSINARARDSPGFVVDDVKVSLNTNTRSRSARSQPVAVSPRTAVLAGGYPIFRASGFRWTASS